MIKRRSLLTTTAMSGGLLFLGAPANAADMVPAMIPPPMAAPSLPAVSAVNAKLAAFGVAFRDEEGGGAVVSLAVPLGERFGGQVDGLYGKTGSMSFYGVAGHLFWRDPTIGLIGAYGSYGKIAIADAPDWSLDGAEFGKVGAEAELYLGRLSLLGLAAYQYGNEDGFAGKLGAAWYATEDLRFDIAGRYDARLGGLGELGATWLVSGTPVALFAAGGIGKDSFYYGTGGVRLYIGDQSKTLMHRDREDDPDADLPHDLYTAIGAGPCPVDTTLTNGFCDGNL